MDYLQRRLVKLVNRVVTHPRLTLTLCGLLLIASIALSWFHLRLSTDQNELLTPKLPYFKLYMDFMHRFPENDAFVILIEPRDPAKPPHARRWIEFADRLSARLMDIKQYVKRVDSHVPLDKLGDQGLLFADWPAVKSQSQEARGLLQLARIVGEAPGLDTLLYGAMPAERLYKATALDPKGPTGSRDFVTVITKSLDAALQTPPQEWKYRTQIPDLTDSDPAVQYTPEPYGYNMVPDESQRGNPATKDQRLLVINVYTNNAYTSLDAITEPLRLMRAAVDEVARDFPEFKHPAVTGRPALDADEMSTSDHDTTIAEILGLSLVFVVLLIFLRSLWLVIVAELCLGTAIGWTFGWATLAVGRLNLLSLVFVIALIGIGMDYLIQILARYRFEKKRYRRPQAVWTRVFRYVSPPISTACMGAAGAFFVSALTDFRGAAELGIIAGGGLLLCLVSGYTLLPALLTLFPAKVGRVKESRRYRLDEPPPRAGGLRMIPALLWILIAAGGLFLSLPPRFDPNLLRLQADGLESVRQVRKLRTWYAVIMSDDLEKLRTARTAFTPSPGETSTIASTDSILDAFDKQAWLTANNKDLREIKWADAPSPNPGNLRSLADAAESLDAAWKSRPNAGDLSELQKQITQLVTLLRDPARQQENLVRLAAWQKAFQLELRSKLAVFTPPPLDIPKLPPELRDHFVSYFAQSAGSSTAHPTYALYIYPKEDLWDTPKLEAFVRELEQRTPKDFALTGIAPQLLYSTQAIHHAFLQSTLYALILIFLLVLLDLRNIAQTFLAISVLALGLPMLLLIMYVWHNWLGDPFHIPGTWNFANFFALPILIGAGHEYGVFMIHRYRETLDDPRRVWHTWDVADRALLLCAIVTSSSFGFLVFAQHHGVASLGWVMAVGSVCIYLATLLVLRPILLWRLKRKRVYDELDVPPSPKRRKGAA